MASMLYRPAANVIVTIGRLRIDLLVVIIFLPFLLRAARASRKIEELLRRRQAYSPEIQAFSLARIYLADLAHIPGMS